MNSHDAMIAWQGDQWDEDPEDVFCSACGEWIGTVDDWADDEGWVGDLDDVVCDYCADEDEC